MLEGLPSGPGSISAKYTVGMPGIQIPVGPLILLKMVNSNHELTMERLTILGILLAIFFGVSQNQSVMNTDIPSIGWNLKVLTLVFFSISLFLFLMYLIGMAIKKSYRAKKIEQYAYGDWIIRGHPFFYDLGIATIVLATLLILIFWSGQKIETNVPAILSGFMGIYYLITILAASLVYIQMIGSWISSARKEADQVMVKLFKKSEK